MVIIPVWDNQGTYWELHPTRRYREHFQGLVTLSYMRMRLEQPMPKYQALPLPVFTDWWPE